jgi:hypothetical protein
LKNSSRSFAGLGNGNKIEEIYVKSIDDIVEKNIIKVACSFCGKEIDCPESMNEPMRKHMCFECFQKGDDLPENFHKMHIEIPSNKTAEILPQIIANQLIEILFQQLWNDLKQELKPLSKKELAERMFGEGAYAAIYCLIQWLIDESLREDITEPKGNQNKDKK